MSGTGTSKAKDLRQFLGLGVGYGVVLLLGFALTRQLNLMLAPEEMGKFTFAYSVIGLCIAPLYLSLPQAFVRFHIDNQIPQTLYRKLWPVLFATALATAVVLWFTTHCWYALTYAFIPFFFARIYLFRAQMRVTAVNAAKVVEIALPLLALLFLAHFPQTLTRPPTANLALALYGLGYASGLLFPKRLTDAESPSGRTLLRFLGPLLATTLVAAVSENLVVIVTKSLLGYDAAAQMGVAVRNLIFIKALFEFFRMFFPVIYFREMRAGTFRTMRLYRLIIVAASVAFVGLMAVGAPLLYRLSGATAYLGSSPAFILLSCALLADFLCEIFSLYFQYEIKTWKILAIKTLSLAILAGGFWVIRTQATVLNLSCVVFSASLLSGLVGITWAILQETRFRCRIVRPNL